MAAPLISPALLGSLRALRERVMQDRADIYTETRTSDGYGDYSTSQVTRATDVPCLFGTASNRELGGQGGQMQVEGSILSEANATATFPANTEIATGDRVTVTRAETGEQFSGKVLFVDRPAIETGRKALLKIDNWP